MTSTLPKNSINPKDISVVVQGAVDAKHTPRCLASIRKYLPGAYIILSTWEGQKVEGLDCDKVVTSTPPASVVTQVTSGKTLFNNTNRMVFGVQQGLAHAQTLYTFKVRTDIILQDAEFLNYFDAYPKRQDKFQLFKHRVLNYYLFAPQFNCVDSDKVPTLFHPSDWMFFGLTEDVKRLFDIPLQPDPEYSLWWGQHSKPEGQIDCWPEAVFRYAPEQYVFYQSFHRKFPEVTFDNYLDITREKEQISRRAMVNNFVILDFRQWHIEMPKYQHVIGKFPYGQTSHVHWQQDYKKYCDPVFKISNKDLRIIYEKIDIGEILKNREIALEKKIVLSLFPNLYKKHLYKKYGKSPAKLKAKLEAYFSDKKKYIYTEDVQK